jgi:hypothetical protein
MKTVPRSHLHVSQISNFYSIHTLTKSSDYDVSAERDLRVLTEFKDHLLAELPKRLRGCFADATGDISEGLSSSLQNQILEIVRTTTETAFRSMTGSPPDASLQHMTCGDRSCAHKPSGRSLTTNVQVPVIEESCLSEPPARSNAHITSSNDVASRLDPATPIWYGTVKSPNTINHPNEVLEILPGFENWDTRDHAGL